MTSENIKKELEDEKVEPSNASQSKENKEKTVEEKLKESEEKLLRSLAEIENQRRRFEKEIKDAFEFGSYNFAKESLSTLDNLQRAKEAIQNDEKLKDNQDLDRFLDNIQIILGNHNQLYYYLSIFVNVRCILEKYFLNQW